jgi:hypothetical protein
VSDSPTPSTWETAAPSLLWGVFAFAFGFEGVATLFEGKWMLSAVGVIGAVVLTGVAMKWKRIAVLFPRLSATATLVATDARAWIATLAVAFAVLFGPVIYQRAVSIHVVRSDGRIAWNLDQAAAGGGFFLNMTKTSNQGIRVLGFQAHGRNISNEPIYRIGGQMLSHPLIF